MRTLTGLYNRQAFQREVESTLLRTHKQLKHAALLMLDMDNLKYTNDTYGHDWGDQYIRTGRQMLRRLYTKGYLVCPDFRR